MGKKVRHNYEKKKLLENLETDTGFNIICCSCNEYKSRQSCVNIIKRGTDQSIFSPEQEYEFLLKDDKYNLSIDGNFYICLTCKNQIKSKKKPKRNDREFLQYYDFPDELFQEVKQNCNTIDKLDNEMALHSESPISSHPTDEFRLNKLENFIFKLTIPFIRIANCKMGRYLKVQGNLILISSDIEHSLARILPQEQKIIPVCLKRKLCYQGFYLEEYVDKEKIKTYMKWLQSHNPLFTDIKFDSDKMIHFEEKLTEGIEEYNNHPDIDLDDEIFKESLSDDSDDEFEGHGNHEPLQVDDEINVQHYDSVMCNKYEQEVHENSVASRYADIITQYETDFKLPKFFLDDFANEEGKNGNDACFDDLEESLEDKGDSDMSVTTPFDIIMSQSENLKLDLTAQSEGQRAQAQSQMSDIKVKSLKPEEVKQKVKERIGNINAKIEKVQIAPGEFGKFKNWGQDIYIEERAFPHLFPYGVGGYMSTVLDGKETDMGFSNYVRHRLMHVDSRYRKDTVYVFFLLLVKEYVELQRCKDTYLRQARIMPSLTRHEISNLKHENLTRYNRRLIVLLRYLKK